MPKIISGRFGLSAFLVLMGLLIVTALIAVPTLGRGGESSSIKLSKDPALSGWGWEVEDIELRTCTCKTLTTRCSYTTIFHFDSTCYCTQTVENPPGTYHYRYIPGTCEDDWW